MHQRRPNIVFILADDHASHSIGAYGSIVNRTPRIDEIANAGALLENCFCTNAICTPSRATILTGTYSHVNGVTTLSTMFDASQPTFISALRQAGYKTAVVGKWHLGHEAANHPVDFDYWDVLVEQGEYFDPTFQSKEGLRTERGYATDVITDLSLRWVESMPAHQPWCLLVHHKAPHRPWEPDDKHAGMYSDPIPVPSTFNDDYSSRSNAARHATMRIADYLTMEDLKQAPPEGLSYEEMAVWKYQRYMEDYLAVVASVDDNVGRLIDALKSNGQFEDTVFAYTSDQGFFLGDHGWFDKRFMYEESLRMPFVISYPRAIQPATRLAGIVTNVDIAQTLLEAAGVAPVGRMQGRSFWADLTGGDAPPPAEGLYYRYWENDSRYHHVLAHYGYRTERYKLIYFYNDGMGLPGTSEGTYPPEWELYDLEQDPDELSNVYFSPDYQAIRDELKASMWKLQQSLGDRPHSSQPCPPGCEPTPPSRPE